MISEQYNENLEAAKKLLDFGDMLLYGEQVFKIVSLTSYITHNFRYKKNDMSITPYQVLIKAAGKPEGIFVKLYEMISILCELTIHKHATYNLYGCKNATEILDGIKTVLNDWLPF